MPETLDVRSLLPNKFEPKRQNRWVLAIEGIDAFLCKSAKRPSISFNENTIEYINSKRYLAGKADLGTLDVTLYDPIAPSGAQQVMEWIRTHTETVSGRSGYADFYKRDCQIKMLDPVGTVVELWDLKGCWLTSAQYGDLDYTAEDPTEVALTIRFDNCVLQY